MHVVEPQQSPILTPASHLSHVCVLLPCCTPTAEKGAKARDQAGVRVEMDMHMLDMHVCVVLEQHYRQQAVL